MKASYLVCYDIRNERRLARLYRHLKGCGIHIQYSVFHCRLSWRELIELKRDITGIISESEDDVRIYPLPTNGEVFVMGIGDRVPEGVDIFLT